MFCASALLENASSLRPAPGTAAGKARRARIFSAPLTGAVRAWDHEEASTFITLP
jgi:hypothetical protein